MTKPILTETSLASRSPLAFCPYPRQRADALLNGDNPESIRQRRSKVKREFAHRGNNQLAVVKGMAVQNGALWVQSPELELRDLPGDTPNRLRKARAKELSES